MDAVGLQPARGATARELWNQEVAFTQLLIVCFKVPAATHAMAGSPWWQQTASFVSVAHVVDILFLICAAIIPMAKALYLVWTRDDKLEVVHILMRTT